MISLQYGFLLDSFFFMYVKCMEAILASFGIVVSLVQIIEQSTPPKNIPPIPLKYCNVGMLLSSPSLSGGCGRVCRSASVNCGTFANCF